MTYDDFRRSELTRSNGINVEPRFQLAALASRIRHRSPIRLLPTLQDRQRLGGVVTGLAPVEYYLTDFRSGHSLLPGPS